MSSKLECALENRFIFCSLRCRCCAGMGACCVTARYRLLRPMDTSCSRRYPNKVFCSGRERCGDFLLLFVKLDQTTRSGMVMWCEPGQGQDFTDPSIHYHPSRISNIEQASQQVTVTIIPQTIPFIQDVAVAFPRCTHHGCMCTAKLKHTSRCRLASMTLALDLDPPTCCSTGPASSSGI